MARLPLQIRSSFFVEKKAQENGLTVTVFVAEHNGDGTYLCHTDRYGAADESEIRNEEPGGWSGSDCEDRTYDAAPLKKALEWIAQKEEQARASGQFYKIEERLSDRGLVPHFTKVAKSTKCRTPEKKSSMRCEKKR